MKSMILAAGFGTRFRPITWTLPKPLVPVCNRPLIAYAVENYLRAGAGELVVNLHHLPGPIERFLTDEYGRRCRFHFSREEQILGTGGGVARVRQLLAGEDEFYLVNGDTIQFPPFAALSRERRAHDAVAALTLRHPPARDRFTAVWFHQGLVTGFGEGEGQPLMFSGAHAIGSRIFRDFPDEPVFGIVDAVYKPLLHRHQTIAGVVDDGLWFDIGTPQRYLAATRGLRELMLRGQLEIPAGSHAAGSSIVHDTARIGGPIGESVIGRGSVVEGEIRDTAVWDGCRIARGVKLTSCILANGVEITGPLQLTGAIVCRDDAAIPRDGEYRFESGLAISSFQTAS